VPFERRHHPLAPRAIYLRRLAVHALGASALVGGSLIVGVLGYHGLEHLPWIDALVNASMLMGGMGPVDTLHTTAGKLFASAYALYCGLVLLIAASVLFAPVLHRLLHSFHVTTAGRADD
jgi:hypothetical protein